MAFTEQVKEVARKKANRIRLVKRNKSYKRQWSFSRRDTWAAKHRKRERSYEHLTQQRRAEDSILSDKLQPQHAFALHAKENAFVVRNGRPDLQPPAQIEIPDVPNIDRDRTFSLEESTFEATGLTKAQVKRTKKFIMT